jgi:hypothetical protein
MQSRVRVIVHRVLLLGVGQFSAALFGVCIAQTPATNLDILRDLMGETARAVRGDLALPPADRVSVAVLPADIAWAVDEKVMAAFAPVAPAGETTGVTAVFGLRDVRITYENVTGDGLFADKTAERRVRLTVAVRVTRKESGAQLLSEDLPLERTDRIPLSELPAVEHPTLALARGTLEPERLFQGVAEPLILIGAIGVAVFLLFHVRS